ncbi:hypothetical protein BDV12DRAFT_181016 [Aspergillus spectabilis]
MQSGDKEPYPESLSESEKRHFNKYGKLQHGGLFGKRSKERTYFDSGDFAVSTDNGARNVDKGADEDLYRKSANPEIGSLLQQTDFKYEEPTEEGKY